MQLRCIPLLIAFLAVFTASLSVSAAYAQGDTGRPERATYTVRSGDTLFDLAEQYFRRLEDYRIVQRINKVKNPRKMPIGKVLQIPYSILKYSSETAQIAAFRGTARVSTSGQGAREPRLNETIGEGAGLATGAASSLSLAVSDGSIVTLPSNSTMKIVRLRRFALNDSIDFEYALEEGAVRTNVAPLRSNNSRFRVRTPSAVSAVRGTDFRTRFDVDSGQSFIELIEGGLDVSSNNGANTRLDDGYGAIIDGGQISTEALLAAPHILENSGWQREEELRFAVDPIDAAAGYRLIIARDSSFIDIVEDMTGTSSSFTLEELEDGNYFAKMSAFSGNGLEGLPSQIAFKRRLNSVMASAGENDEGYEFRWVPAGKGERLYRLQIYASNASSAVPIVDEAGLTGTSITLSDLPPGEYRWRVGSSLFDNDTMEERWTDFQTIRVDDE